MRDAMTIGLLAVWGVFCTPAPLAAQNPCPVPPSPAAFRSAFTATAPLGSDKRLGLIDDVGRWGVLDSVWNHRTAVERGLLQPLAETEAAQAEGDIAVLQDEGDLFRASNIYDLRDVTLRFAANEDGGYDVTHVGTAAWRSPLGGVLTLADDDSTPLPLSFDFAFYAATHAGAFVNSDGNITFEEGDDASTTRGVSRLLSGPPRVAPFLADLDPSTGGGVYAQAGAAAVTVTWCDVPGFESQSTTTVQVSLLPTGVIEMTFESGRRTGRSHRRAVPGAHDRVRVGRSERHGRRRRRRRRGGRTFRAAG